MKIQVQLAETLGIERRLRKGDAQSTALFSFVLEKVIRNVETNPTGIISTERESMQLMC
jgi:hypothetical protein